MHLKNLDLKMKQYTVNFFFKKKLESKWKE